MTNNSRSTINSQSPDSTHVQETGQVADRALLEPARSAHNIAELWLLEPRFGYLLIQLEPLTEFFMLKRLPCNFFAEGLSSTVQCLHAQSFPSRAIRGVAVCQYYVHC